MSRDSNIDWDAKIAALRAERDELRALRGQHMSVLAEQIAQVREFIAGSLVHANQDTRFAASAAAVHLDLIERHIQEMEAVLHEICLKPYRAEEVMLRYRDARDALAGNQP